MLDGHHGNEHDYTQSIGNGIYFVEDYLEWLVEVIVSQVGARKHIPNDLTSLQNGIIHEIMEAVLSHLFNLGGRENAYEEHDTEERYLLDRDQSLVLDGQQLLQ